MNGYQQEFRRLGGLKCPEGLLVSAYLNWERRDGDHFSRAAGALRQGERRLVRNVGDKQVASVLKADFGRILSRIHKGFSQGTRGVCFFASEKAGVFEAYTLPFAVETRISVSDTPLLIPLARISEEHDHALAAFVDAQSASVLEISWGTVAEEVIVPAEDAAENASAVRETSERIDRRQREYRKRYLREVAERLAVWADRSGAPQIFIVGQERMLSDVQGHLPDRVTDRVSERIPWDVHKSREDILDQVLGIMWERRNAMHRHLVHTLLDEVLNDGRAVVGPEGTLGALQGKQVDRLVVSTDFRKEGARCECCGLYLWDRRPRCPQCDGEEMGTVCFEREIVNETIRQGGEVTAVSGDRNLIAHGGVGAFLRFV